MISLHSHCFVLFIDQLLYYLTQVVFYCHILNVNFTEHKQQIKHNKCNTTTAICVYLLCKRRAISKNTTKSTIYKRNNSIQNIQIMKVVHAFCLGNHLKTCSALMISSIFSWYLAAVLV